MNNITNQIVSAVVSAIVATVIVLGFGVLNKPTPVTPTYGSLTGNQIQAQVYLEGGLQSTGHGFSTATTSVVCVVPNSTGASTTIAMAGWLTNTSTTTTQVIGIATTSLIANALQATTTAIVDGTIAANTTSQVTWVPGTNDGIIGPKGAIVFFFDTGSVNGASSNYAAIKGTCAATFLDTAINTQ
jgi:hypothetical protein